MSMGDKREVPTPPSVSVCVCTRRRSSELARLLQGVRSLIPPPGGLEIIVVENDGAPASEAVVRSAGGQLEGIEVSYFVEPRPNIALARNMCVARARGDWVAFIDDDEVPSEGWIAELCAAAREYGADGVFGPVIPRYPADTPAWVIQSGMYERPRLATGQALPPTHLRTSNALVARKALMGIAGPFDPEFGLTGGEDYVLFSGLHRNGLRFIWCDAAPVFEYVEARKLTLKGLLGRSFSGGQTYARALVLRRGPMALAESTLRGVAGVLVGAGLSVASLVVGRSVAARWLFRAAAGLGKLSALFPFRYRWYRSP